MPIERRPSAAALDVLRVLMAAGANWRHGYDLLTAVGIASGTLYPMLMRWQERGWLETQWEPSPSVGRPPRHLYRLSTEGVAYAKHHLSLEAPAVQLLPARMP